MASAVPGVALHPGETEPTATPRWFQTPCLFWYSFICKKIRKRNVSMNWVAPVYATVQSGRVALTPCSTPLQPLVPHVTSTVFNVAYLLCSACFEQASTAATEDVSVNATLMPEYEAHCTRVDATPPLSLEDSITPGMWVLFCGHVTTGTACSAYCDIGYARAGHSQCAIYPFELQSQLASNSLWDELQYIGFNWARRTSSDESLQTHWYSQLLQSLNSWCISSEPDSQPQDLLPDVQGTESDDIRGTESNSPETHWSASPDGFCNSSTPQYTIVCRTWVRTDLRPQYV